MPASPLILPYADAPARWGIVCERKGPEVTITIPRRTPLRTVITSLAFLAVLVATLAPIFRGGGIAWVILLGSVVLLGGIAADKIMTLPAMFRFAKPLIIELNGYSLTIHNYASAEEPDPVRPRSRVYEIKYVPHSGNLVIHSHNLEMIELRPCPDPAVLRWMAETLTAALHDAALHDPAPVTPARIPEPAPHS